MSAGVAPSAATIATVLISFMSTALSVLRRVSGARPQTTNGFNFTLAMTTNASKGRTQIRRRSPEPTLSTSSARAMLSSPCPSGNDFAQSYECPVSTRFERITELEQPQRDSEEDRD